MPSREEEEMAETALTRLRELRSCPEGPEAREELRFELHGYGALATNVDWDLLENLWI